MADEVDRLGQHLLADRRPRPAVAEDVLVQVLAGSHAQEEAALEHLLGGRGGLGDYRRVDPDQGTGDAGADAKPAGRLGDGAERRPDEWTLALLVDPRVVVVGDRGEAEARLLGHRGLSHQRPRSVLLAGETEADLHLEADISNIR